MKVGKEKTFLLFICILFIVLFASFEYLLDPNLFTLAFYIIPLFISRWYIGRWAGITIPLISIGVWLATRIWLPPGLLEIKSTIFYSNVVLKTILLFIIYYMTGRIKDAVERENNVSRMDFLTQIPNRRFFIEFVTHELLKMKRYKGSFLLMLMDVDGFKKVNDAYGHKEGDNLLCAIAGALNQSVRAPDIVARFGGDEFSVFLVETKDSQYKTIVMRIMEQLNDAISAKWHVTMSAGVIYCNSPDTNADKIIGLADKLLYQVKNSGKNSVLFQEIPGL